MAFFHMFDDDWLNQEGEPSDLPREQWNPEHSANIARELNEGRTPDDILVCNCPHCGSYSWYDGGFTCWCEWCGKLMVSPDSEDEVMTLEDVWTSGLDPYWEFG